MPRDKASATIQSPSCTSWGIEERKYEVRSTKYEVRNDECGAIPSFVLRTSYFILRTEAAGFSSGLLEVHPRDEREEAHLVECHVGDLSEQRTGGVHIRVLPLLTIEQVL